MCLTPGGTPERHRLLKAGFDLPPLEDTREALIGALREEIVAGAYQRADRYHPLLGVLLEGLVTRDMELPTYFRTPVFPLCDAIQGVALVFGIAKTVAWFPDPALQGAFLLYGHREIVFQNYVLARLVVKTCCARQNALLFTEEMEMLRRRAGMEGLILENGLEEGYLLPGESEEEPDHCVDCG